jgi:hypothetical protein
MAGRFIGEPTCVVIIKGISKGNNDRTGLPTAASKAANPLTTKRRRSPMAASVNVSQSPLSSKSPISKSGVLTLHGFGVRMRIQSGHLEIEDGIERERRHIRIARVGHGLRRLVCISEDGFATLSALKWLADVGASFLMLNRSGKVLLVTGPTAPSDSRLRRAQALAFGNVVGSRNFTKTDRRKAGRTGTGDARGNAGFHYRATNLGLSPEFGFC